MRTAQMADADPLLFAPVGGNDARFLGIGVPEQELEIGGKTSVSWDQE